MTGLRKPTLEEIKRTVPIDKFVRLYYQATDYHTDEPEARDVYRRCINGRRLTESMLLKVKDASNGFLSDVLALPTLTQNEVNRLHVNQELFLNTDDPILKGIKKFRITHKARINGVETPAVDYTGNGLFLTMVDFFRGYQRVWLADNS